MSFTVREQEFAGNAECAEYFGLSASHVAFMRRSGRTDQIGLRTAKVGKWKSKPCRKAGQSVKMRIRVRGMDFEDADTCAAHFGLAVSTIRSAVAAGRADSIGMPFGPAPGTPNPHTEKPITIGPFHFPSRRAAAKFLGIKASYVERAAKGIKGYYWDKVVAIAMEIEAKNRQQNMAREKRALDAALRSGWAA